MPKLKILFLCTGNSCRSQMAEGFARHLKSGVIEPYSAGVATHGMNPLEIALGGKPGHDPVGWPTFKDWPAYNSLTHEGSYWKWLERAWRGHHSKPLFAPGRRGPGRSSARHGR